MGIIVPQYTTFTNMVSTTYNNVYISLRFENLIIQHNWNGTYTIQGRAKVYQNNTDMFVINMIDYTFTLQKDQLNAPLHKLVYNYLKTQYNGSYDAN